MSRILIYLGLPIGLMVVSAVLVLTQDPQPPQSSGVPIGGKFELTDFNRQDVTERNYNGKKTVVFFGYTFCPDICPTSLFTISQALNALGEDSQTWRVLFISIDPARDTPEILKQYVSHFHDNIVGLTGTPAQIKHVAKIYGAYYSKLEAPANAPDYYAMAHTSSFYLMHSNGVFYNIVDHETPIEELVAEMKRVL